MGEIGRSQQEFLYEMKAWQLQAVIRGYQRRNHDLWSATRWQTYHLMAVSMADITEAGIHQPTDLIRFPWEDISAADEMPKTSKEEAERLRRLMQEENERLDRQKKEQQQ